MASTRKLLQEIEKTLKRVAEGLNEVRSSSRPGGARVWCRSRVWFPTSPTFVRRSPTGQQGCVADTAVSRCRSPHARCKHTHAHTRNHALTHANARLGMQYDDTFALIATSETANAREKYETESKNQLKKLQKFREQIKGWLSNSDVKDTKVLEKTKRDIEIRMEGYKAHEKEAKTKAFSKEGLQAAALKVDPLEQAKQEERDWLNGTVETLSTQIEEMEAEMEELSGGKSRKKSKPSARFTSLEASVSRHKEHVLRLEKMLRLLDNEMITVEDVQDVRDFVDDYIDRCMDSPEEFENPDDIYGDLVDVMDAQQDTTVNHLSAKEKEKEKEEKERERQKAAAAAAKAQLAAQGIGRLVSEEEKEKLAAKATAATPAKAGGATVSPSVAGLDKKGAGSADDSSKAVAPPPPPPPKKDSDLKPLSPIAAHLSAPGTPVHAFAAVASGARASDPYPALGVAAKAGTPGGVGSMRVGQGRTPTMPVDAKRDKLFMPVVDESLLDSGLERMRTYVDEMRLQDGMAEKEYSVQQRLQLLQVSAPRSIPQLSDSRWSLPSQRPVPSSVPIPPSFPTQKLALMTAPELFDRLDPETLLYSFSFEKGTLQQFLASRSLKKRPDGWSFDDASSTWRTDAGVWDPVSWRLM